MIGFMDQIQNAFKRAIRLRRFYLRRERIRTGDNALFWTTGDKKPKKKEMSRD